MKIHLQTSRFKLIPVEPTDLDYLFGLLRNDQIKKYLCDNQDIPKEMVKTILHQSDTLFEDKRVGLWLIYGLEANEWMGFCGFKEDALMELIYVVHPDFQRQGVAYETMLAAIEYFRKLYPAGEIFAEIDTPNVNSCKLALKLGMKPIGTNTNPTTQGEMIMYKL